MPGVLPGKGDRRGKGLRPGLVRIGGLFGVGRRRGAGFGFGARRGAGKPASLVANDGACRSCGIASSSNPSSSSGGSGAGDGPPSPPMSGGSTGTSTSGSPATSGGRVGSIGPVGSVGLIVGLVPFFTVHPPGVFHTPPRAWHALIFACRAAAAFSESFGPFGGSCPGPGKNGTHGRLSLIRPSAALHRPQLGHASLGRCAAFLQLLG